MRVLGVIVCLALALRAAPARADRVDEYAKTLTDGTDEKARIAAAVQLGKLSDARGVPALIKALSDKSPVVRGIAANALGHIGDVSAIPALEKAVSDASEAVRTRARDSLKLLREAQAAKKKDAAGDKPKPATTTTTTSVGGGKGKGGAKLLVVVKSMGNKTATSHKDLGKKMREAVLSELSRSPEFTFDAKVGEGKLTQFVIDGSISKLDRGASGPWIEVTAEVKLTVSTAEGKILSIVTGSATVQTPRGVFKTTMEKTMQVEAVENAVRGAQHNLSGFLTKQIAQK